jgi:hypothetical protein
MSRRAHKPDPASRRQVEATAGYGVAEIDIARVVRIDPKALRWHYRNELATSHIKAAAEVAESLFRKAASDGPQSVTAAIFWLKNPSRPEGDDGPRDRRARWRAHRDAPSPHTK